MKKRSSSHIIWQMFSLERRLFGLVGLDLTGVQVSEHTMVFTNWRFHDIILIELNFLQPFCQIFRYQKKI